jgi:ABC-type uncharacterized transport system auxiliary subunit
MRSSCRRNGSTALILLLMAAGAAACAVDLGLGRDDVPARTYWLTPPDVDAALQPANVSVTAVPGLDTDRMLALDPDQRLVPYAGARWNGPIPQLVQSLASRSLDDVGGEGMLRLEVRRFFVEQDRESHGAAVIELAAWHPTREDRFEVFVARSELAESRLGAVAAGFQQAVDRIMSDLAEWLAR